MLKRIIFLLIISCQLLYSYGYSEENSITDLGIGISPRAINNNESIVFKQNDYPFSGLWENGDIVLLDALRVVYDINDHRVIAGKCIASGPGLDDACIWENGVTDVIGSTGATSINESKQVTIGGNRGPPSHSTIWDNGETTTILNTFPGANGEGMNYPNAINNPGQVVGYYDPEWNWSLCAYLWDNGNLYNVNELVTDELGYRLTDAIDINDQGQIIGPTSNEHSFLFENGSVIKLGDFNANAINNNGQIVGGNFIYIYEHELLPEFCT